MRAAIILGAGFSKNSGLPVQSEIPGLLIENCYDNKFETAISLVLKRFYEDVFGFSKGQAMPELDDILTCIDISTNAGHHLGIKYSSLHLRAVRRFLIYRLFTILREKFIYSEHVKDLLLSLMEKYNKVDFIVLNWDTVLENYINIINPSIMIDYCNGGKHWARKSLGTGEMIKVIKIHGSINWLYCDNCRVLINDTYCEVPPIKRAGFKDKDFKLFDEFSEIITEALESENCFICGDKISSHIATFSFRKSFRENSFPNLWNQAEDVLTYADKWIFIGYSLPQADYEVKHLLKIAQLKLSHLEKGKPEIDVVLLNSKSTVSKYRGFFGDRIGTICNGGITEYIRK
ncbi:MAG: hypothetical protein BWY74_02700 [Firmicutes bacterium ADurb.Bin419]|nr:MAG: hypothetical protein BWY74_02700 [Firmicutes bacterium ADurb.Bin419]